MIYTVPHYYNRFSCVASECQDTCCARWQIMIDDKALKKYRNRRGPLGNRLYNSIDWKEHSFKQYDGRCAFLAENNLCDLYSEAGPEALCRTCRLYPRHIEEFEGVREISLSLSCIEAAKLILGCEEAVTFRTVEREGKEEAYEFFDFLLYTKLCDGREQMIRTLQDRALPLKLRISLVLALGHDLQNRAARGELCLADRLFAYFAREDTVRKAGVKLERFVIGSGERYRRMKVLFGLFDRLEVLKKDWPEYLGRIRETLYGRGPEEYERQREAFLNSTGFGGDRRAVWERWGEQLMVYFIFTYFCGAVYDGRVYGKTAFAAVSTVLIQEMAQAVWQERGGALEFSDMVDIAHRYSKEVEHSDHNLNAAERMMAGEKQFGFENLLGIFSV